MAVVATVANMAQPTPPSARKPRKTGYVEVMTLARSMSAINSRPQIMRGRPRRPSKYPVGMLAIHFPAPKTTGIKVTIL
jgi:hypothetical protein